METAVGEISDVRVGVGNIWEDDIVGPDGETVRASRATLSFMFEDEAQDFDRRVAAGDEVSVNDELWRVVGVHEPETGLGTVTLERA